MEVVLISDAFLIFFFFLIKEFDSNTSFQKDEMMNCVFKSKTLADRMSYKREAFRGPFPSTPIIIIK